MFFRWQNVIVVIIEDVTFYVLAIMDIHKILTKYSLNIFTKHSHFQFFFMDLDLQRFTFLSVEILRQTMIAFLL